MTKYHHPQLINWACTSRVIGEETGWEMRETRKENTFWRARWYGSVLLESCQCSRTRRESHTWRRESAKNEKWEWRLGSPGLAFSIFIVAPLIWAVDSNQTLFSKRFCLCLLFSRFFLCMAVTHAWIFVSRPYMPDRFSHIIISNN